MAGKMYWRCHISFVCISILGLVIPLVAAVPNQLKFCALESEVSKDSCFTVAGDDSPVKCEPVIDSVECAIKLGTGAADFGIFTADELLVAHNFYTTGLQVVAELKSKFRSQIEPYQFQTVVVVTRNYTAKENSFGGLIGAGYCHPGFGKSQIWSDFVMKYFEEKVLNNVCRKHLTVAENEIINLKEFFKKGCRPGEWSSDPILDKKLKKKYPQLCELCGDKEQCSYDKADKYHGHFGALDCLTSGRGQVAYADLHYVQEYFKQSNRYSDYQLLCENGTVMPIDTTNACTWFKEPWKVIVAREDKASEVLRITEESSSKRLIASLSWQEILHELLFAKDTPRFHHEFLTPVHYLNTGRGAELPRPSPACGEDIRWCTVSDLEYQKCNWTSAASMVLGIKPPIACVKTQSPFECFDKIAKKEADIISIDSNYGYLARSVYGLSPVLFCETYSDYYSFVVAAVRANAQMKRIRKWEDVRNSKACFPEYGGISWLSFVNAARDHRILSKSCDYPSIVAKLLDEACTPGFAEANHAMNRMKPSLKDDLGKLCKLCPRQPNVEQCEANQNNPFYGDRGALECLKTGNGDIAFFELTNVRDSIDIHKDNNSIIQNEYRVLCKNGSLALNFGFDVDAACALSVTIDSEVVSRRDLKDPQLEDVKRVLLKIRDWLGYRGAGSRRIIRVFDRFNGSKHLLFKDSTTALLPTDSTVAAVQAYRDLFSHVDSCNSVGVLLPMSILAIINFLIARFI
ncbi:hypothetical protein QAD02_008755 [Eretmocerus hayati]|uniref:Uncharacterized protein n=1 Tax=Eretmocerus hayati TaxID=131215 RepID=A0ACC2N7Z8_9HYME|nr:hypothetical protein QAD02_008755 [Eretmocerus hayati]